MRNCGLGRKGGGLRGCAGAQIGGQLSARNARATPAPLPLSSSFSHGARQLSLTTPRPSALSLFPPPPLKRPEAAAPPPTAPPSLPSACAPSPAPPPPAAAAAALVLRVLDALLAGLDAKAKASKSRTGAVLLTLNNVQYLVSAVGASPALAACVPATRLAAWRSMVEGALRDLRATLWAPLVEVLGSDRPGGLSKVRKEMEREGEGGRVFARGQELTPPTPPPSHFPLLSHPHYRSRPNP